MRFPRAKTDDSPIEQPRHALDHVAIGHRDANDRYARARWRSSDESPLALQYSDEPMKLRFLDVAIWT